MDRFDGKQDDLFENSTMTFGEHLRELQRSLTRAAICLGVGVLVGMLFASYVVDYVKTPLEQAIHDFNAGRGLARMGLDPRAENLKPLRETLANNAFVVEEVINIPGDLQTALMEMQKGAAEGNPAEEAAAVEAQSDGAETEMVIDPRVERLAELFAEQPTFQLRKLETNVSSFEMTETFMIWFKAALVIGALL
ncbi:MAG: twin-arginine translocase subunit TatC, partial [Planctomycetota bacterium]